MPYRRPRYNKNCADRFDKNKSSLDKPPALITTQKPTFPVTKFDENEESRSIIIRGIPEDYTIRSSVRCHKLSAIIDRLIDEMEIEVCPVASYRIGKLNPASNRPRLVKVTFAAVSHRVAAVKNSWKLKENFADVFIRPSYRGRGQRANQHDERFAFESTTPYTAAGLQILGQIAMVYIFCAAMVYHLNSSRFMFIVSMFFGVTLLCGYLLEFYNVGIKYRLNQYINLGFYCYYPTVLFQKTAKILVAIMAVFIVINEQRHFTKRQTKITGNMVMMIVDSCIIYVCNTCAFWIIRKANDATRGNKQ